MRKSFGKSLTIITFSLLFSVLIFGQSSRKPSTLAASYVITAKAGGVNFVSGSVAVSRADGTSGALTKGSQLENGDEVKSSSNGKAEILLNPGSFVRLAENSELQFISTSLDDLQVKVNRGSAIFEVVATKDFTVSVKTPKSGVSIAKSGIYRVDVAADGYAKLEVWKGKAQLNKNATLKGGQTSGLDDGQIAVAKFDRDDKDSFELWSKDRAKELAKINDALIRRQMTGSLIAFARNSGWSDGFGLWIQDPLSRSYCFLPYNYGFSSPYGYGYNQSVWNYSPAGNSNNSYNNNSNNQGNSNGVYNPPGSSSGGNGGFTNPPPSLGNPSPPVRESPQVERPTIGVGKVEQRVD